MNSILRKLAFVSAIAVGVLLCAISGVFAQSRGSIKLNEDAFAFAARLINDGHVMSLTIFGAGAIGGIVGRHLVRLGQKLSS